MSLLFFATLQSQVLENIISKVRIWNACRHYKVKTMNNLWSMSCLYVAQFCLKQRNELIWELKCHDIGKCSKFQHITFCFLHIRHAILLIEHFLLLWFTKIEPIFVVVIELGKVPQRLEQLSAFFAEIKIKTKLNVFMTRIK